MHERVRVDLDLPAGRRMEVFRPFVATIRALIAAHLEPAGIELAAGDVLAGAERVLRRDELDELMALAALVGRPVHELILVNAYYDVVIDSIACTAVGVDAPDGPWHARNLDWEDPQGLLRRHTLVLDFVRGGAVRFTTIGWPGFVAALSGVAPGRFAVTLNAVVSGEPRVLARPTGFVLREALDRAVDFAAAVDMLRDVPVLADCLLLVTGARRGELAVIERTPLRAEVRLAENGVLAVTNDYRALDAATRDFAELGATACSRYDRAVARLAEGAPPTVPALRSILDDPAIRWEITVQQMVLRAADGTCEVWTRPAVGSD